MSRSPSQIWISLGLLQCVFAVVVSADSVVSKCDFWPQGPKLTVTTRVRDGPDCSNDVTVKNFSGWLTIHTDNPLTCNVTVSPHTSGAYKVLTTLPDKHSDAPVTLSVCANSPIYECRTVFINLNDNVEFPTNSITPDVIGTDGSPKELKGHLEWCVTRRHRRSMDDKRVWAGDDMQWLKRSDDDWDENDISYNKRFDPNTMDWLRKRSLSYPWSMQKKPTWNAAGVNWLKKRAWTQANTEWIKRSRDFNRDWLKRGWSSGDVQWLRKRAEPFYYGSQPIPKRWNSAEVMNWLKKRSDDQDWWDDGDDVDKRAWQSANTEWIKRNAPLLHHIAKRDTSDVDHIISKRNADESEQSKDLALVDKKNWGASGMSWIKRDSDMDKKNWGASGMSWIKRDDGEPDKKNWGASGMSWIKRNPDDKRNWGASGMSWIKRDPEEDKRNWGASGMSWIKRDDEADKRNWGASGMSWIKRNPDKKNWGASGMSWIKREPQADKKNWGASGMSWIKRDEPEASKKNWGASGMSWIKRDMEADKKNWGASGMSWIKRGDMEADKKNWGASGMSWIKRGEPEADKKNWGASGMSWIKRDLDEDNKRNWGASGMSWIKRGDIGADKKNWGASGMSWIKRNPEQDKRNWGASGMSWIKRDDMEADKKNWGASGMSWIKRAPEKKNWGASGMSWIKRSKADEILDDLEKAYALSDDVNVQKRDVNNAKHETDSEQTNDSDKTEQTETKTPENDNSGNGQSEKTIGANDVAPSVSKESGGNH